jgi:hypothetical protein
MAELDISNWINLGILVMTALVGILTWLGSRNAAREARQDQEAANAAADRSASAAEEANKIQTRLVEIEEQRHQQAALDEKKAALTASLDRTRKPSGQLINHWDLVVSNQGAATARNLAIKLKDKPFDPIRSASSPSRVCEIVIGPGAEIKCPVPGDAEFRPPFECELSWDDDSGIRGSWRSTLT